MFDKIVYISDHSANIKLKENAEIKMNLMNLHLVFEDKDKTILGEVDDLSEGIVKARFLGEIRNGRLIGGVLRKPSLDATIRVIEQNEIPLITGEDKQGFMPLGVSPYYNDFPVYLDVNNFFSNHFAILGNSGSGKSCGVSRIVQNMFEDMRLFPYKSNLLFFDSSGEYYNAFKDLNRINPNYHYKFYTTNETDGKGEALRLPIWLLNVDDLVLLLQVTEHSQIPIIERMLKLVRIFAQDNMDANAYKNHLIAKAIMAILYTNQTSPNKRNDIFSIIGSCSTPEFNLESPIQGIGYVRKFRECFLIDSQGQFTESVLLTEYVSSFINPKYDDYEPEGACFYTLADLEKALNFTLISEGWLRNENTYGDAVTIRVRLHSLITSNMAKYFDVKEYISLDAYLSSLLISDGMKYQIVNINLDDVDDSFAKVITKVYTRLIFNFAKGLKNRASIPFHIIVEEAHRYIQHDTDQFLIGYNIFDRVAKEGRKYGVLLGLISQRPVELSDTVISQCSNFLIFKMNHPTDVDYIKKMVPNISEEIVEKQKSLQAGTCLAFGMAFKIPLIVKLKMPNPEPKSGNCDVVYIWNGNPQNSAPTPSQSTTEPVAQPYQNQNAFFNETQSGGIPEVSTMPGPLPTVSSAPSSMPVVEVPNQTPTVNPIPAAPTIGNEPVQVPSMNPVGSGTPSVAPIPQQAPNNSMPLPMIGEGMRFASSVPEGNGVQESTISSQEAPAMPLPTIPIAPQSISPSLPEVENAASPIPEVPLPQVPFGNTIQGATPFDKAQVSSQDATESI